MRILNKLITLSILLAVCFSFSAVFVTGQTDPKIDLNNIRNETVPSLNNNDPSFNTNTDIDAVLNATTSVNRSIFLNYYGIVSINDNIKFNVIGNESILYFNYTLPNININNLTYSSFRVAGESFDNLSFKNSSREYVILKGLNYTTFRIAFNRNLTAITQNDTYYIQTYLEFAYPYEYTIENGEQILHYTELLYPLINNVPLVNSSTSVEKQSGIEAAGEKFLDDDNHQVTPQEYMVSNASSGILKWANFSREAFNHTQSYSDDLLANVWLSSISTAPSEGQAVAASTVLFKSLDSYRKMEISPYGGSVTITETHMIKYLGPDRPEGSVFTDFRAYALNSFQLTLEPNASVHSLTDQLGHLNTKYQVDESSTYAPGTFTLRESNIFPGYQVLTVHPRYPVSHGETIDCKIVYSVPIEEFLLKEENSNRYSLRLTPISLYNWTIDNLELDIRLPRGAVYTASNYSSSDPYQALAISYDKNFKLWKLGFERILTYKGTDLSPSDNSIFYIDFMYSRLNLLVIFLIHSLAIAGIISAIIGIRWLSIRTKEATGVTKKEFIPVEDIRLFVKLYEESLAIKDRIRETKQKVAKKKLTVREGKQLLDDLSTRLRKVEEKLQDAKAALLKHGGRYKEAVQEIEINERKLQEERRNQLILRQEYRKKKTLTRDAYRKLFRERQRNIERLKNDIDGRLVALRLLLEE